MKSFSFGGYSRSGFAEDVLVVSGTTMKIPLFGTGPLGIGKADSDGYSSIHEFRVDLLSPLASDLTIDISNDTQSTTLGSFTISAGNLTGLKSVDSAFNINVSGSDHVFLTLSVASGSVFVPGLQWYVIQS